MSQSSIEAQLTEHKDSIVQQNNTIQAMAKMLSEKDARIAELTEELRLLRKSIFGSSRERPAPPVWFTTYLICTVL